MKKVILTIVVVGMLGWAVYDFAIKDKDTAVSDLEETEEANPEETDAEEPAEEEGKDGFEVESGSAETKATGPEIGEEAPDFELQTLEGEQVKLSDYEGEPVMLNFWATWCPPCRAEMPDMEKFYNNEEFTILAVNLTDAEQSLEDVEGFVDEFGVTFPILLDEKVEVAAGYGVQPIPTSYMIDSEGIIQHKSMGPMQYGQMVDKAEELK